MTDMTDEVAAITIQRILEGNGFTSVRTERRPLPEYLLEFVPNGSTKGTEALGNRLHYFRVTTDQGEFGMWTYPYYSLDLHGTGVVATDLHQNTENFDPEFSEVCGIDLDEENTVLRLWQKLVQRQTEKP